jgi:hypothetical protein
VVIDAPSSRMRSAPQGYVEVKGTFEPIDGHTPRQARFLGKPCVWYTVKVECNENDEDSEVAVDAGG